MSRADLPIIELLRRLDCEGFRFAGLASLGLSPSTSILQAAHAALDALERGGGDRRTRSHKRLRSGPAKAEESESEEDEEDEGVAPRVLPDNFFRYTCQVRGATLWVIMHEGLMLLLKRQKKWASAPFCHVQLHDDGKTLDPVALDAFRRDEEPVRTDTSHALTSVRSTVACAELPADSFGDALLHEQQWRQLEREYSRAFMPTTTTK
jgi:hypothetical protein